MRIEYDPASDALYLRLRPRTRVVETVSSAAGVNIDVDEKGNPIGIEILYAVRRLCRSFLTTLDIDLSNLDWSPTRDRLLATEEVSRLLGVSRQYVARLARAKRLPATRAGRAWLIHESGVNRIKDGDRHGRPTFSGEPRGRR